MAGLKSLSAAPCQAERRADVPLRATVAIRDNAPFMRGSRRCVYGTGIMATVRSLVLTLLAVLLAGAAGHETSAAEHRCLTPEQRRAAVSGRQAVPLTKVIHLAKSRLKGDIVNARLCEHGKDLVYVLTVLARDGKVTRASIDGASGSFLHER
jgi:uncharacterized membrane protein YkoI